MKNSKTLEECGGVSLIHPYYKDEKRLNLQFDIWADWSPRVCANVDITIVDDGSPIPLELTVEQDKFLKTKKLSVSIFRILKDIKYNTSGALNLGVTVAPKPYILFMDSDCFFDSNNWEKILDIRHDDFIVSKFDRKRLGTTESPSILNTIRYLNCTMLMHKRVFWNIGGFDEDFNYEGLKGGYGFFDTYFDACSSRAGNWSEYEYLDEVNGVRNDDHHVYHDIIAGEWMPSICGAPASPSNNSDLVRLGKALYYDKRKGRVPQNRQILNFPWKKVYDSEYPIVHTNEHGVVINKQGVAQR